jgi:hypothetical protein
MNENKRKWKVFEMQSLKRIDMRQRCQILSNFFSLSPKLQTNKIERWRYANLFRHKYDGICG